MSQTASRKLPALYLVSWSAVFLVASTYLAVLVARPDKLAEFLPPSPIATGGAPGDQDSEVESLRRKLVALESDRSALRLELARRTDHETQLTQRVASLEQQAQETTHAAVDELRLITSGQVVSAGGQGEGQAAAAVPELPVRAANREARRTVAKAAEPQSLAGKATGKTPVKTKVAQRPTAPAQSLSEVERLAEEAQAELALSNGRAGPGSAIETGSVLAGARAPLVFGAPTVSRIGAPVGKLGGGADAVPVAATPGGTGSVGVRLGTGPSVDALRMTWGLVHERGGSTLGNLEPRYMASRDPTAGGTAYDLVAGPLRSADEAQRVCSALRAQQLPCTVSSFGGNAL